MSETTMIVLLTLGPLLWMIGGTWWKPARRYIWPVLAGVLISQTVPGLSLVLCMITMVVVNSLGYGEGTPWWQRGLIFIGYSACGWWISPASWWLGMLAGTLLLLLMALSQKFNELTWKIWEASAGLSQASALILAVLAHG